LDTANSTAQDLRITIESGSTWTYTASMFESDANYISNIFGTNPRGNSQAYVYTIFNNFVSSSQVTQSVISSSMTMDFE